MKTFAYLYNPMRLEQLKSLWPVARLIPDFLLQAFSRRLFNFKPFHVKKIRSKYGKEIQGYFIAYPFLSKLKQETNSEEIVSVLTEAAYLAKKLGAEILGFCGYHPKILGQLQNISQKLKIAVTGGYTFNAWAIFEALYRITKAKGWDLKKSKVVVCGVFNPSGILFLQKLYGCIGKIIIYGNNKEEFLSLKESLAQLNPSTSIEIIEDFKLAVWDADIVVNLDPNLVLELDQLKNNAIFINNAYSNNNSELASRHKNINFIKGGIIQMPDASILGFNIGLPEHLVYSCMAETMLLTLEEKFVNYSLSENINLDKLEEIANFAARHGFEVYVP